MVSRGGGELSSRCELAGDRADVERWSRSPELMARSGGGGLSWWLDVVEVWAGGVRLWRLELGLRGGGGLH